MIKNNQTEKARLGAIGEHMVLMKLMEQGYDAFNANITIKNYKSIDLVVLNSDIPESTDESWKPKSALIQVKTSVQSNIPAGFSIEQALDKEYLERMVKGPYVFVKAANTGNGYDFRFFILSRQQFIDLLYASHNWYVNEYEREAPIKLLAPAGLSVSWMEGKDVPATSKHPAFINPLGGVSCEDAWENIWKP